MRSIFVACLALFSGTIADKYCPSVDYTFTLDPPFDNFNDVNCPYELGDDFELLYFSWTSPSYGVPINLDSIPVDYDSSRNTIFIVHGWINQIGTGWLESFKDTLMLHEDLNVIKVGWGGENGAGDLNYWNSAATTRSIGAYIGEVAAMLVNTFGANPANFQCVGHSLGAHLCGHMGMWLTNQHGLTLGRCTGLDPAGPQFSDEPDRRVGINPTSGAFVDILHTDEDLGTWNHALGHTDAFPNRGPFASEQPGCFGDTCDHLRAVDLYEASINPVYTNCFQLRSKCTEYLNIPSSCTDCSGVCSVMGHFASDSYEGGYYYTTTTEESPFC